jgi:hypothetical protein
MHQQHSLFWAHPLLFSQAALQHQRKSRPRPALQLQPKNQLPKLLIT